MGMKAELVKVHRSEKEHHADGGRSRNPIAFSVYKAWEELNLHADVPVVPTWTRLPS